MASPQGPPSGLIGWFAHNHIAANLLMITILVLGAWSILTIKKETLPSFERDRVSVSVQMRGGTPEEVERGVLIKIEEAIETIEGIDKTRSTAYEGRGRVDAEVKEGYSPEVIESHVKQAVDTIASFPNETEPPRIWKSVSSEGAINVQVWGDLDEKRMRLFTENIRNEILELPEVSDASLQGARNFEISIEIPQQVLREYGLTLAGVAQTIRRWSVDIPGGTIRSHAGNIRVRSKGQAYTGDEFEKIVLLTSPDGTLLRIGDIATVRDSFAEQEFYAFFNGKRSLGISVIPRGNENAIAITKAVREYVNQKNATLPEEVRLTAWADTTYYLKGRMNMMLKNMVMGAVLVFVLLGLFLHLRIAAWVIVGLPVAFMGCFALMPQVGVTVNLLSLFGFILVIGIVVDDAIIIAESAYTETEAKGYSLENIVAGTKRVALPASIGVLTTIAAFVPMLYMTGIQRTFAAAIGWVVILCLAFSLIESKLILPSHLALMKSSHGKRRDVADWIGKHLKRFIRIVYIPLLRIAIANRYTTLSAFVFLLVGVTALVISGHVRLSFFPEFESDYIRANVTLDEGTSEEQIKELVARMQAALDQVNKKIKLQSNTTQDTILNVFAWTSGGTSASFQAELAKHDVRQAGPRDVERMWREETGQLPGTSELTFSAGQRLGGGAPVAIGLSGTDPQMLQDASEELMAHLESYEGVYEIQSSAQTGPEELRLEILPAGEAAGLTLADLASQVRQAFFGVEAQRIQRGESEVRVMVRYPRDERKSIGNLENMWLQLPSGAQAPFASVGQFSWEKGFASIRRENGKRLLRISANVNPNIVSGGEVASDLSREFLPELATRYPSLDWELVGGSRDEATGLAEFGKRFLVALALIYVLLAIPLRSYLQPVLIMSVIPFGIIGAVVAHAVMGITLGLVSFLGIVALSGVVVNDSLILVDYVNRRRNEGIALMDAILSAGKARFRPILLTSLTTFFGLLPILSETSLQAQIIIPMAASLAGGILFATAITLILIPCLYRILMDIKRQKDHSQLTLTPLGSASAHLEARQTNA